VPPKKIVATHVKDIEWIISLCFAVHGGDPAPHEVLTATEVERAAVGMVRAVAAPSSCEPAKSRCGGARLAERLHSF
jgi:hypothetical protein